MFQQLGICQKIRHQFTTIKRFAGHSKWSNIKHDKAIIDQKRSIMISKYLQRIKIAIQDGGGQTNPALNSHLRSVMEQAIKSNVPLATLNNQIQRYNPKDHIAKPQPYFTDMSFLNKVFLVIEAYPENGVIFKNNLNTVMRKVGHTTLADIRHMFDDIGFIHATKIEGTFANASEFEEKLTEDAIECNIQEVEDIDFLKKCASFIFPPLEIERVNKALTNLGYTVNSAERILVPSHTIQLTEAEAQQYEKLKEKLRQIEVVANIFDNVEPSATE